MAPADELFQFCMSDFTISDIPCGFRMEYLVISMVFLVKFEIFAKNCRQMPEINDRLNCIFSRDRTIHISIVR